VLVLLACAALALTRAILRPLRKAAELAESAGQAAGGEPSHGMPRRGLWAGTDGSRWPLGMTFTRMPQQLSASRAAEAAARRSADEMSRHLGETARELLRSVNVVRGFAEYYRQQPKPPAASLDRMLRRVANEAAQMETLIEGLEAPLSGSAGPRIPRDSPRRRPQPGQPGRRVIFLDAIARGYPAAKTRT
jgi:signal transduction histidine kinase